jgi:hypothetical protein
MKTKFKVGQSVVYKRANGDSVSATVTQVADNAVVVAWATGLQSHRSESVQRAAWSNLTPFGNAMFLTLS